MAVLGCSELISKRTYPEEVPRGAVDERAVLDLGLGGQIFGRVDGRDHAFDGQEGRQVGRVGRDEDEREEPPDAADDPARDGPRRDVTALLHERTEREPERVQDAELVDRGLGDRVRLFACK